jgi:hypothetical protein
MYLDSEARSMEILVEHLDPEQIAPLYPRIRRGIMDRIQACEAGLYHPHRQFEKQLQQIDPLLRLRWNVFEECYVVDRWTPAERCYTTVLTWKDENGPRNLDGALFQTLRDGDTWQYATWQDYLKAKHAKSAARRAQIKKEGNERIAAAVDGLTKARAQNFMEVEQAFKTGERVIFHGASEQSLERMNAGAIAAAARGEMVGPPAAKLIRPRMFAATLKAEQEARDNGLIP